MGRKIIGKNEENVKLLTELSFSLITSFVIFI